MTSNSIPLHRYQQAIERTARLGSGESPEVACLSFPERAEYRLERMREMVTALGNPLESTPIVHVAGTSGKGSTATAIASILTSAGYRTGLHTSPYLQVATEKLQIDRELIAAETFAKLVSETLDRLQQAGFDPSYGQLWIAMVLAWFEQERVDVAVIEVGAGGRFDLSNVVHPLVAVITEIGFDHMDTLGATIEEIAWHKAGIIEPVVPVVTAVSDASALRVIRQTADDLGAELHRIAPNIGNLRRTNEETARLAVELLGFEIGSDEVDDGLARARLPGRTERVQNDPLVILDGAHNPQKVDALVAWWERAYPDTRPVIVAGFLESKDAHGMLESIAPFASALILTEPFVEGKAPTSAERLAEITRSLAFTGPVHREVQPRIAVELALERARRISVPVLVTGSLYLIGNVRSRWYPDDAVLLERTSWPARRQ